VFAGLAPDNPTQFILELPADTYTIETSFSRVSTQGFGGGGIGNIDLQIIPEPGGGVVAALLVVCASARQRRG
jgi:hypothetical protein